MAKVNARGARELCSVTGQRTGDDGEITRSRFLLRSDGAVLFKLQWWQRPGQPRETRSSSAWSTLGKLSDPAHHTRETLVRVMARRGYHEVTADTLNAERRATTAGAVAKRKANQGPDGTATQWAELHMRAHAAGMLAGEAVTPMPMVVQERVNPLDDSSPVARTYAPVMDGACGFAYVTVRPATSSFARWAKANRGWFAAYGGGLQMSVDYFNQSVTRKAAYASAFAMVLREAGLSAYGSSRMD